MMDFQAMQAIKPLWGDASVFGTSKAEGQNEASISTFASIFQSAIDNVRETDAKKNEMEYLLAVGQLDNPSELTIAAAQASMSVELLVQLRNKAVESYNSLMQMGM